MGEQKMVEMSFDEYLKFKSKSAMTHEERENQIKNVAVLLEDFDSTDPETKLKAFSTLGKILTGLNAPWEEVIKADIIRRLVKYLHPVELPHFQLEALGIISSLVECPEHISDIMAYGIVGGLRDLVQSPEELIRAMAIAALGKIAKESEDSCRYIIKCKALELLLPKFSKGFDVRNASWMLRLFCDKEPQLNSDTVKQVLGVFEENLFSNDEQILVDTCLSLASLCKVATSKHEVSTNPGVCCKLVDLLNHPSPVVVEPALEAVTKIATGDQMEIEHIVGFFMFPSLVGILGTKKYSDNLKINVCKILSCIASTGMDNAQEVVGHAVYVLSDVFEFELSGMELKMEIARTIATAVPAAHVEAIPFVRDKCMKTLCDMLNNPDLELVDVCLAGIEYFLKEAEVSDSEAKSDTKCSEAVDSVLRKIKQVGGKGKIKILKSNEYYKVVSTRAINILNKDWPLYWG